MKEVEGRPISGGGMSIHLPRWRTGGHGDLVSAFVLSVYQLGGETMEALRPKPGSPEWIAGEEARAVAAFEAEKGKEWWEKGLDDGDDFLET
jgi:hypothetical protein